MLTPARYLPLLLSLSASAAWAAPGGSFEYKVTSARANGQIKVAVSGKNVRSDMEMTAPGMGAMQISLIVKDKQTFLLNTRDKTYSEVNKPEQTKGAPERKYTVKKLGPEKVGKWTAMHVELTDDSGEKADVWTTKEIDISRSIFEVLAQRSGGDTGMMTALASAGAEGFPVKMVSHSKRDSITLELVRHDATNPAASNFQIPADWKQADPASVAGGALPPEARKKMEEAMKNLTPEQKKMLEEAIKKNAAGQQ